MMLPLTIKKAQVLSHLVLHNGNSKLSAPLLRERGARAYISAPTLE